MDPSGHGRDSLGRGTSPGEVASAVAADKAVQREREARWSYLQGAYHDPHAARAALDKPVKRQGWTSAAARVAREPERFGELRGKEEFFADAKARAERDAAQRAADATGIPRLSAAAEAAISTVAAAKDDCARVEAWRTVQGDKQVAGELQAFGAVVEQRFGGALRPEAGLSPRRPASLAPSHRTSGVRADAYPVRP